MLPCHLAKQKFATLVLILTFAGITGHTQEIKRPQPVWWFGESGAANFNYYRGTTQMLDQNLTVPTAFHKGYGVRPYASLFTEYRPNKVLGGMLNIAYDNRGGKFDGVLAPCNCAATLSSNISYITIEPSLRLAPFSSAFYLFAGPTLSFNITKAFTYTQQKQADTRSDWSNINKSVFSAQAGAGIDFPLSSRTSSTQMALSPFVSFQTDLGQEPRSAGSWSLYTFRAGVALKFGIARKPTPTAVPAAVPPVALTEAATIPENIPEKEVQLSVQAPVPVPFHRKVKETFPLLNSVFFDMGSTQIPDRYVLLNETQAISFKEAQLQQSQPDNLNNGRSSRQLAVYHNILNILGDRMRANQESFITLTGASDKNPAEGKMLAEKIKGYLVTVFGIKESRISTEGRDKPLIPSEQPGATKQLALLREGDRRVDITSGSPALLMQVGGNTSEFLKPVQLDDPQQEGLRYSILFDFDRSKSIDAYETFLTNVVAPLISDSGMVIIHGHTDIIGDENYNRSLSHDRAMGAQKIIERALSKAGRKGVRFETYGFGEDTTMAPFENNLTEERFYNRTVIIDIIPVK